MAPAPVGISARRIWPACGAWLEWFWLRRRLGAALGPIAAGRSGVLRMLTAAAVGGAAGYASKLALGGLHPLAAAFVVAALFGGVYLGVGAALVGGALEPRARRLVARGGRALRDGDVTAQSRAAGSPGQALS